MARIGKCHLCLLFMVMFTILISLALIVTSIVTDFWYQVDGSNSKNATIATEFSYAFGMWRRCYKNGIPASETAAERQGDCVFKYKDYVKPAEDSLSTEEYRYISLQRSWVGLMIAAAGLQLFTVLALICGLWPGECKSIKRSTLYLVAALLSLIATMAAVASGISFIALRDIDRITRKIYPTDVDMWYQWSFMLGWIGTGLCLVEGFMFLGLLRMDYDNVKVSGIYQTM